MRTFAGLALLATLGVSAACTAKQEGSMSAADSTPMSAESGALGRVSAAAATPKLAAAECEREMKCENVGENRQYTSRNECKRARGEELAKDFNGDEDCKHGILRKDLEECITRTVEQICRESVVTNVRVSAACGSNDLCVE